MLLRKIYRNLIFGLLRLNIFFYLLFPLELQNFPQLSQIAYSRHLQNLRILHIFKKFMYGIFSSIAFFHSINITATISFKKVSILLQNRFD